MTETIWRVWPCAFCQIEGGDKGSEGEGRILSFPLVSPPPAWSYHDLWWSFLSSDSGACKSCSWVTSQRQGSGHTTSCALVCGPRPSHCSIAILLGFRQLQRGPSTVAPADTAGLPLLQCVWSSPHITTVSPTRACSHPSFGRLTPMSST